MPSLSFSEALQVVTILSVCVLAIDRWIHRREFNESKVLDDVRTIKEQIANASRRSSAREGKVSAAVNGLRLDMREVQVHLKIAHRAYEPYDIE